MWGSALHFTLGHDIGDTGSNAVPVSRGLPPTLGTRQSDLIRGVGGGFVLQWIPSNSATLGKGGVVL